MPKTRSRAAILSLFAASALLVTGCATGGGDAGGGGGGGEETDDLVIQELHDLLPEKVREAGVFTVGTDPQYPPCDFMNEEGEIDGFNHDILMAMAPRLGVEIKQEAIAFDGLLPGVESGRFDAAMECITDNEERQKTVKFVDYAYNTQSVITLAENSKGITENPLSLCGTHAGVQTGTEFVDNAVKFSENCEMEGLAPLQVTNFPSAGDQNTALQSGRIDFAFTSTAVGAWQNRESGGKFEVIPTPLLNRTYAGIVVAKDADDTAEALLGALEAIVEDGTYEEIMNSWDLQDLILEEPGINLATERPIEVPELCGACGKE